MKLKTHKATAKRIKRTPTNKLLKRRAGQDHFNARERGVTTMNKRRDASVSKVGKKMIKSLLPYS